MQDTLNALEALAEYELKKSVGQEANAIVEFTVPARNDIIELVLEKDDDKVETDLKVQTSLLNTHMLSNTHTRCIFSLFLSHSSFLFQKMVGNNINVQLTGKGNIKLKVSLINTHIMAGNLLKMNDS